MKAYNIIALLCVIIVVVFISMSVYMLVCGEWTLERSWTTRSTDDVHETIITKDGGKITKIKKLNGEIIAK